MGQKGSALIEFVIVLPILLFLLIAGLDFIHIYESKKALETKIEEISKQYEENMTFDELNQIAKKANPKIELEIKNENNEYHIIVLKEKIKIMCPGLNRILNSPYEIQIEKQIRKEE